MVTEKEKLRLAILTTETLHHAYFVREISRHYEPVLVIEEKRPISATFDTHHPYEDDRDQVERDAWFDGKEGKLADFAEVKTYSSVNDPEALQTIREFGPDAIVVFGTGRLSEQLIEIQPERIINLHGANPEEYSGIDTHLWAIYHRDYEGLVTTLHRVESNTDRGGVVLSAQIPLKSGMKLSELRKANTEVCVDLVLNGLHMLDRFGQFISRPQNRTGRLYSFMPTVLKEVCRQRFEDYTGMLR